MKRLLVVLALFACSKKKSAPPDDPSVSPWSKVAIGTTFESKTLTHMERPFVHDTETTTKQTLIARDAAEASVKIEISEGSGAPMAQDIKVPLKAPEKSPHEGSTVTQEKCVVPAGTFDCTKTTTQITEGAVTRSTVTWTAKGVPVPVKSVVTNENMTITTELTRR